MTKTLKQIAEDLKKDDKKVQLIYAFNGTGKTRLSLEFKQLIAPKNLDAESQEQGESSPIKILYYNAFTEDLFYWDNHAEQDAEPKLKIQPNSFTDWVLGDQGEDINVKTHFQRYANNKITPKFKSEDKESFRDGKKVITKTFTEVTFSLERGNDENSGNLKISKGEESNFIWSIFYMLLYQVINTLNELDESNRVTDKFNQLEYVFIDDPVSSLDENHLIQLAVDLACLIKGSESKLKFIITTHSPLFYNVLYNELNLNNKRKRCYFLEKLQDGNYNLDAKKGDSNKSFSYHLYLKKIIEDAIKNNQIEKFHFTLLRNLYEKTANFLGYKHWIKLLENIEGEKEAYYKRIITFSSHCKLSVEEVREPTDPEKQSVNVLLKHLINNYGYFKEKE